MRSKKLIAGIGVLATVATASVPAVAVADNAPRAHSAAYVAAKSKHVNRTVRLARSAAKLRGERLRPGYRKAISTWNIDRLVGRERALRSEIRTARSIYPKLRRIAQCESGGNPRAVGGGGKFRGLFQFDYQTWRGVGGHGDPAAAPAAEQYRRAAILYKRRGSSPWPVCGR
jgi:hypothetical protein